MSNWIDMLVAGHHHSLVDLDQALSIAFDVRLDLHANPCRVMSADRFVDSDSRSRYLI
ncbi:MAG: hypothetical protein QE485_06510 [Acidovorax sp.]|uniref:hypothetical protein n=1 Tax=Acidovorax sp. TaxID=1872122 RepID=UPI00260B7046|nr:hypothetical protein [Acidovorax sp.]MDH4416858.1 hypothetical protein [Acidovorax sp.]